VRQQRSIGVYGICRDRAGHVLLVRGSAASKHPGLWQIPGGGVDHGEDPYATVVREFDRETGLRIEVERLVDVRMDLVPLVATDKLVHIDRIVFEVRVTGGTPRPEVAGTTDAVQWCDPAAVPLMPWVARLLDVPAGSPAPAGATVAAAVAPGRAASVTSVQRFSAYGLVTDPAGRILLTRIAPGYPGAGTWHLPGGGTDFGESASVGLLRELREETGQDGAIGDLLAVAHTHNPAAFGPERRSLDWHTVRSIFRVTVPAPTEPKVEDTGGSTDRVAWFSRADLGGLTLNKLARSVIGSYG
jgi:8-oxo-dGTP diphosphatase